MKANVRSALLVFGLFTTVGLLFFTSYFLDDLARMHSGTGLRRFIEEMTGAYSAMIVFPALTFVARRFGFSRAAWRRGLAVAVLAALAYTVAHTTLMAVSRTLIFAALKLGPYDYGNMVFRYPMEAAKDILFFAIMYGGVIFWARIERGRSAELAAADLQAKLAEAMLENLRLQLNPHFLFNTLNAISAVMYEDVGKADAMLAKLSDFLRVVLECGGARHVSLTDEIAVEGMYVDIMRTRLERQLSLRVHVADDARSLDIPFLLLQPLLENCIRHGLRPDGAVLEIDVDVRRENGSAVVDVSDNGNGYRAGAQPGHGLRNVQSRLSYTFGPRATWTIGARAGGGTRVSLTYPATDLTPA